MGQVALLATGGDQIAQTVGQDPQRVFPLVCVFAHQAQAGSHKRPFIVRNITGATFDPKRAEQALAVNISLPRPASQHKGIPTELVGGHGRKQHQSDAD